MSRHEPSLLNAKVSVDFKSRGSVLRELSSSLRESVFYREPLALMARVV